MFKKLFLLLVFSLPLHSNQVPLPIRERTLSVSNGQSLREILLNQEMPMSMYAIAQRGLKTKMEEYQN